MKIPAMPVHQYRGMTLTQIRSAIRKEFMTWPKKFAAIQQRVQIISLANGNKRAMVECSHCNALFQRAMVECNHKTPVGALRSADLADIEDYRVRMFRPVAELEPVCKSCHRAHTKQQLERSKQ